MSDGNILLMINTHINYVNLGKSAISIPLAQKINTEQVDKRVMEKWSEREGKKYFIVNDAYSSEYLTLYPSIQIKCSTVDDNYVLSDSYLHVTKIVDENHAKDILRIPGMIGRDLNDLNFRKDGDDEYLVVSNSGGIYLNEQSIEELKQTKLTYKTKKDHAQWYKIGNHVGGEQISITTTKQAAVYVYNKYGTCIYTTFMKNQDGHILLPKQGYILLTGEDNNEITIQ